MRSIELFTIGHSNHSLEQFLDLLQRHAVEALVDIRRFPGSRAFPQFNRESLAAALRAKGIEYHWIEALGGRRPKTKDFDSPNHGLRNSSFRNYADYMLSDDFRIAMDTLAEIAESKPAAIMCAESVFWRCHRRLVSDYVTAHGGAVQHIFPNGDSKPHSLTSEARVRDGRLTYPGAGMLFE